MKKADLDFVHEMVIQLDLSIASLVEEEKRIKEKISEDRIEELEEYWNFEITEKESQELTLTFDYWDKVLIRTWARLRRAHESRVKAGQTVMKNERTDQT
ncbi:MAG: hypothetical protein KAG19_07405 [Methylococcales bacterium]|nr:hypothetical protein [Methylococcales bacterium]